MKHALTRATLFTKKLCAVVALIIFSSTTNATALRRAIPQILSHLRTSAPLTPRTFHQTCIMLEALKVSTGPRPITPDEFDKQELVDKAVRGYLLCVRHHLYSSMRKVNDDFPALITNFHQAIMLMSLAPEHAPHGDFMAIVNAQATRRLVSVPEGCDHRRPLLEHFVWVLKKLIKNGSAGPLAHTIKELATTKKITPAIQECFNLAWQEANEAYVLLGHLTAEERKAITLAAETRNRVWEAFCRGFESFIIPSRTTD